MEKNEKSGFNEKAKQGLSFLMRLKTKIWSMECHLGIHVFLRGEKLGLHLIGCERGRRFVIFLHKNWRLRIKEQEESLVVENQGLKGNKN